MEFLFENLKIVPLELEQTVEILKTPTKILEKFQLPDQEIWNEEILFEITYNTIIPNIQKKPQEWLFFTRWLAIETQNNFIIGDFMLKYGLDEDSAVEIGYGTNPKFQNKGYMTKAVACFIEWAKQDQRIKIITAETEPENMASIRVLEKNDFVMYDQKNYLLCWERVL